MKALVLSGGSGTRLRPLTHTSPKQLVPVGNQPVLYYVLQDIARVGITDVGIVVGETAFDIYEAVGDGSKFGLQVTYIAQDRPLGLAHAVLVAQEFLGTDDFVMYLGDCFVEGGIGGLLDDFRSAPSAARLLLSSVPEPTMFGVAEVDDEQRVLGLEEKPEHPKSDLAVAGVYLFTSVVHTAVRAIDPSARGELEITDAIQWLIDTGHDVRSTAIPGFWKDTGNVDGMLAVNRAVLAAFEPLNQGSVDAASEIVGPVRIEAGAQVRGSKVIGPVAIGCNAVITDSYIGPYTSIADNCHVDRSEIEYSIVLADAQLDGVARIHASLIGRHARVRPAPFLPIGNRLVIGDHSEVEISS